MATTEQLRALLDESRNGCNEYIRHPLARKFIYTDGVQEVADLCGAYWLLDIIGTEAVPALFRERQDSFATVALIEFDVKDDGGYIRATVDDDHPAIWKKAIDYTDFPAGSWIFKLGLDGVLIPGEEVAVMCLLSED